MIKPISQERWQEAQTAEIAVVSYERGNSRRAYEHIFSYLGIELDQGNKVIAEIGCGAYPAVSFCTNVDGWVFEPLWFQSLQEMKSRVEIYWIKEPFEDANISMIFFHEVWLFNVMQHVRDPESVITKAKEIAPVIRFFEPVDYPTCVYHPHTFTEDDFERWFGDSVKRYTDRLPGFFDADCCYGTWRAAV
jgi:hypothetical protein